MLLDDLPLWIARWTVIGYWSGVVVMVLRRRLLHGRPTSGMMPNSRGERLIWPLWEIVALVWLLTPWLVRLGRRGIWGLSDRLVDDTIVYGVRLAAALLGVACLAGTIYCWRQMGKSWSVVIDPSEPTKLVTSGPYRFLRHPIYALSILIVFSTTVVAPVWPMIVAAVLHVLLMHYKSHSEERFLISQHGAVYDRYCRQTGRFWPRFSRPT